MLTLKALPGVWLCRITQDEFTLMAVGVEVQRELLGISGYYFQVKSGQCQIMPDHLHVLVHVVATVFKRMALAIGWSMVLVSLCLQSFRP